MAMDKGKVCVTGAGGFVASWVVKLLLSNGYTVHGTVREPRDEKNAHLNKFEKASENLKLFKADLLDYDSLLSAIKGCSGVFHVASPVPSITVPNPEDGIESKENIVRNIVDVCDLAAAVIMAYEKPESDGRYICVAHKILEKDMVEKLRSLYPNYKYPKCYTETHNKGTLTSEKLQSLGWKLPEGGNIGLERAHRPTGIE